MSSPWTILEELPSSLELVHEMYFFQNFLNETGRYEEVKPVTREAMEICKQIEDTQFEMLLRLGLIDSYMKRVDIIKTRIHSSPEDKDRLMGTLVEGESNTNCLYLLKFENHILSQIPILAYRLTYFAKCKIVRRLITIYIDHPRLLYDITTSSEY